MSRVLICDDYEDLAEALAKTLEAHGISTVTTFNGRDCVERYGADIDVVLCDLALPDIDGIEVLKRIKNVNPEAEFLIMTAHGTIPQSVEAMRAGARDFITKPMDDELLVAAILEIISRRRARPQTSLFGKTASEALREVYKTVGIVAKKEVSVLITGETGTGKELLAREIHRQSRRADGPFVAVNCPAIPANLVESELFGHQKGAFTGAHASRPGRFKMADEGTLLLDELADLHMDAQVKILRSLQERTIEPVGGSAPIPVDVRIVAATSVDLEQAMKEGRFRSDLYYRLADIVVKIPPLRERLQDLPQLVATFAAEYAEENGETVRSFSTAVLDRLCEYDWPGNVRELRAIVRRLLILSGESEIRLDVLPKDAIASREQPTGDAETEGAARPPLSIRENEALAIQSALEQTGSNITQAAQVLGIGRTTLYRKMKKYGIAFPKAS